MDCVLDPPELRLPVDQAMALVPHHRWLLGAVRDGRLRVIADSSPAPRRPFRRSIPLSYLARRSLHERRPLTVSSTGAPDALAEVGADWELDWPALLYAPVGMPRQRPIGLLVVGSQRDHWY